MLKKQTINFFCVVSFIFCLWVPLLSFGQKKKAIEGFIVTRALDTVACLFSARNWTKQPFEIKMKLQGKDSLIKPNQIAGFFIPSMDIEYKAREIRSVKYVINIQEAENGYKPDIDTARYVFIKTLYRGNLSLLMYQDKIERKHFFVEVGNEITEIYSHLYSAAGNWHNNDPVVEWYKQYISALKVFMNDCRSVYSLIDVMELNEASLLQLFKTYDYCLRSNSQQN